METHLIKEAVQACYRKHRLLILMMIGLTVAFSFLSNKAVAQVAFAIGPKAGVSINRFYGLDANNVDARTTFIGGVFINAQISPVFAIQPELLLSQRGAVTTNNNVQNKITINYFEVPVLAKLRLPVGDNFFPHLVIGPNFGYRTNLTYTRTDTQSGSSIATDSGDIDRSDVGGLVGVGFDLQSAGSGLFFTLDGRYGFGFKNLGGNVEDLRLKNTSWTFAAGIGLRLGRKDKDQ